MKNIKANRILRSYAKSIPSILINCTDLLYLKWRLNHAAQLKQFQNRHKGEDCFIIGSGPSLNTMDLTLLHQYHTFGLNKIYLLFDRFDLDLTYLVAINRLVIEQSALVYQDLPITLFLNYKNAHKIITKKDNIYLVYTGAKYTFKPDITRRICEGATVTYVALQIAYYMGFRNVFLIGVDHHFKVQGKPYAKQFRQGEDTDHFDPNYFGNQEWQLPNLKASEFAYDLAKHFYHKNDRRIYDATVNGKLNIFPKISFEEALERCKQKT
jgi:hypothetical protein